MNAPSPIHTAALRCAAAGWSVLPVEPKGKKPLIHNWPVVACTLESVVNEWWTRFPNANLGILCGRVSQLCVLDVDPRAGGDAALANFIAEHGPLPETLCIATGGGGEHYYFSIPREPAFPSWEIAPGLEVKADGRFVVAPPSVHPSGALYVNRTPGVRPSPEVPAWMVKPAPARPVIVGDTTPAPRGPAYALRALAAESESVAKAGEGQRNETLNIAAFNLGQLVAAGELDEADVRTMLESAADQCGLIESDGLGKVRGTIESGLKGGARHPRSPRMPSTVPITGTHHIAGQAPTTPESDSNGVEDDLRMTGEDKSKPDIIFRAHESVEFADEVMGQLASEPDVFQRSMRLVRVIEVRDNRKGIERPEGALSIEHYNVDSLSDRLARLGTWVKSTKTAGDRPIVPPPWLVRNLLTRSMWDVPTLHGLSETPVLRPDGSIATASGYDPATGVLVRLTGEWPAVPSSPSAAEVRAACAALAAPLVDFPFAADSDRVAVISAIITAIARPAIDGVTPLYAIRAPAPGTGKTLLADVVSIIATGRQAPRIPPTREEEETRKRISSVALAGMQLALLDNVDGMLGSPALANALTAPSLLERVMGTQETVHIPHRVVWFATGNNLAFRGDVARRVVPINLNAHHETPELRGGFQIADLLGYVRENRRALVASALTILRAYCEAGRPAHGKPAKGSFEPWDALVRGALIWTALGDCDAGSEAIRREADPDKMGLDGALRAVYAEKGKNPWTTAELAKLSENNRELAATLHEFAGGDKVDSRKLGLALRKYRERISSGLWFDLGNKSNGIYQWKVCGRLGDIGQIEDQTTANF